MPPPVRQDTSATPNQLQQPGRRITRFDTKAESSLPRVLTVPQSQSERPRSVSVAPGITVLPPYLVPADLEPIAPGKRPSKKVPNYSPDQQHPAVPAYSPRETSSWTKPDTHTHLPRRKTEPEPKKRGLFSCSMKPKDSPLLVKHPHITETG
jgi:hypothetical protein